MEKNNLQKFIPTLLNNVQNKMTEVDLNLCFENCKLTDFLINRKDFPCEENSTTYCSWDEGKVQKAATEKWNSLSLQEKKDVVSKWVETFFGSMVITTND